VNDRHIVTIQVDGRPATFATASERPWKAAIRTAVQEAGCESITEGRFAVRIDFRLAEAKTVGEVWDLDNLIKSTLDAMEGIFGLRPWKGHPQPADDRVDRLEAQKRKPGAGERPGATIDVWLIEEPVQPSDL
jgi:Holliday junction resolvase RusA-like endonuclease